jgi:AcrR family transcriptional regulator
MVEKAPSEMRQRLLAAATELFYAEGLRAVSVDRVVEHARTTKVTFYRHFKSKDDLVVAYLQNLAEQEQAGMRSVIAASDAQPARALGLLADQLGTAACATGFRGCPFINAAAEYPDPSSTVRRTIEAHRDRCRMLFEEMIAPLELDDQQGAAADLMLLRDGVMVGGYLDHRDTLATSFLRSSRAITGSREAAPVR